MARAKKETRGRKLKLTKALAKKIKDLLAKGYTHKMACVMAGISVSTFYSWLEAARELEEIEEEDYKFDTEELLFLDFLDAVEGGSAAAHAKMIECWLEAAEPLVDSDGNVTRQGDWRAAESWLKRRLPDEFAEVSRSEIKTDMNINAEGQEVGVMVVPVSESGEPQDLAELLKQSQAQTHQRANDMVKGSE